MKKLSEYAASNYIKLLCFGDSGRGKTVLSASFPIEEEFWDFDNKVSSAAIYYSEDKDRLAQIDVKPFVTSEFKQIIPNFRKRFEEVIKLNQEGKLPFKTLVLDSITTFSTILLSSYPHLYPHIKRADGLLSMQDYQILDNELTYIIRTILSFNCNVVVTGHLAVKTDENTGMVYKKPMIPGAFADKVSIYFEEVYLAKNNAKGEYILQTKSDMNTSLRCQRKLHPEIKCSYEGIIKNIKA